MNGHTPGPWTDFDDYEVSVDAESNVGNKLAGWFVIGNPGRANGEVAAIIHFHGTDEDEWIANGHLIAAAPDLLENGIFLIARLDDFERELTDGNECREYAGHVAPAIARLKASIAKATGAQ